MNIYKLTASFGKFNNESISFHEGLNIISAPNESGKSTWCAFILAMLYGVDSAERSKAGSVPVKEKYAPWSGVPMEGSMETQLQGKRITVTRKTKNPSLPMRDFSAVYSETNIPVESVTEPDVGEQLTGVTKEVFIKSAFTAQGDAFAASSPEMEKRIQTILSSGEEGISFSEADDRLKTWEHKRRSNKKGILPETEAQISELSVSYENAQKTASALREAERKEMLCSAEREKLEASLSAAEKKNREQQLSDLNLARNKAKSFAEKHRFAQKELHFQREELKKSVFGKKSFRAAQTEAKEDLALLKRAQTAKKPGSILLAALFCLLPALLCMYLFYTGRNLIFAGASVIAGFAAALLFLFYLVRKRKYQNRLEGLRNLAGKYGAADRETIADHLKNHQNCCKALKNAWAEEQLAYENAAQAYESLYELEKHFAPGWKAERTEEEKKLLRQLSANNSLAEAVKAEKNALADRLSRAGDPARIAEKLAEKRELFDRVEKEYDAIRTAREVLQAADREIHSRFLPELGKKTAEYMSFITGGKYNEVTLDQNFSAMAKANGEMLPRNSAFLSAGTADVLYLSVRLALCTLALPQGESCPLILDDALVNLDDERYGKVLLLLEEIAQTRQVIFFTCRRT